MYFAAEITLSIFEIPGINWISNLFALFKIFTSVFGEYAYFIPNDLTKYKSSRDKTVPIPILNLKLEFLISSIAFFDCFVLNLISKLTIPESYKHFARSKDFL